MRKMILLGAILLPAALLFAQGSVEPLNVKPGQWEVTMTTTLNGMGTPRTHTYKSCVKKENLTKYPFNDSSRDCNYKVLKSTGKAMEVQGSCPGKEGVAEFHIQLDVLDSEHVKGTGDLSMNFNGQTMNGKYDGAGKWIGDTCTAD
jgi:hypothetical protein